MKPRFPVQISMLPLAGALAFTIAACHAGSANAAPADACKLIPATTAANILDVTKVTTEPDTSGAQNGISTCQYDVPGHAGLSFMLRVRHEAYTDLKQEVSDRKSAASSAWPKTTLKDVTGSGDAAFVSTSPFAELHVFSRGAYVWILTNHASTSTTVAQMEKLARVALANLK